MKTPDYWAKSQMRVIKKRVETKYGKDARRILAPEVYDALLGNEILLLILTQEMGRYEPAQDMIRRIRAERG